MVNMLRSDPTIRQRYQFWFYQYTSNMMIAASAVDLRDTVTTMVSHLDPHHQDPALSRMVVIGHSQGGLLTHMTAVAPGDRLWQALEAIDAAPVVKSMLSPGPCFFEPLAFVRRVIFISTPHRGSFLSKSWVRNLARRLLTVPADLVHGGVEAIAKLTGQLKLPDDIRDEVPTSVDGMSPENPLLQALASLPLASGITGHSIIAVLPGQDVRAGNDGVVEYQSAHFDGVESEFIVRSGHSCQGNPLTIEEVRRILMKHLNE